MYGVAPAGSLLNAIGGVVRAAANGRVAQALVLFSLDGGMRREDTTAAFHWGVA